MERQDGTASLKSIPVFLAGVFFLSIPFWTLGAVVDKPLLPGLPISALMVIVPTLVAAFVTARRRGSAAVWALFRRAIDIQQLSPWAWPVALCTMPTVMLASGLWLTVSGQDIPQFEFNPGQTVILLGVFFLAATAEEIGWTGFATDPLLRSTGIFTTGLLIGAAAALWHFIPLTQADRSISWIAWWTLGTVMRRILMVWVYARGGGSVFGASLFHAMSNVSWMLFPIMGSHYDPRSTALASTLIVVLVAAIETMSRARSGADS
ncbi:MAG: CPBP family intramembrane glutamic endopeptidase [Pseudomonadota bacterium]